jgi:NitT/TauT family transport system substrate-binding protein
MQRRTFLHLLAAVPAFPPAHAAADKLVIAVNQTTIESAALLIQKIPGVRVKLMPTGRAASAELIAGTADAATGNETQALLSSVARPELRVVLTLAECRYRVVARWSAGITGVADLRGKRIAYTPNTSAQYFLLDLLRAGGVAMGEIVPVLLEPAEMPAALAEGRIDAMAIWELQPQVALDRLGGDGVVLTNPAPDAYVERFGLNTTAAVLGDRGRRAVLVNALRAINQMSRQLAADPRPYLPALSRALDMPVAVIEKVLPRFRFTARLDADALRATFGAMEPWAAAAAGREVRSPGVLARVVDGSAAREAELWRGRPHGATRHSRESGNPEPLQP